MLWETTGETPVEPQIKKRKWKWIGHTIRKDKNAVERIALDWNPHGTRKRGRPKKTWRKSVMEEAQGEGRTWREVKRFAGKASWKPFAPTQETIENDDSMKTYGTLEVQLYHS
jgi:hypothetical protein